MANRSQQTRLYPGEQAELFLAACQAAAREDMKIVNANPAYGVATLSTGMTMASWGENLDLHVLPAGPGAVSVTLSSGLKFGLVDWGRNKRNIDRFFTALSSMVLPAPPGWLPDPAQRHQYRWWDGQTWTANISDGGQTGHDPIG